MAVNTFQCQTLSQLEKETAFILTVFNTRHTTEYNSYFCLNKKNHI